MTATRDAQRQRVYDVEHQLVRMFDQAPSFPTVVVLGSTIAVPYSEMKFSSLESVTHYLEAVISQPWFRERFPRAKAPLLQIKRGVADAHYQFGTIHLPPVEGQGRWAWREIVVLHELAHHLTTKDVGHGDLFTEVYQWLFTNVLGEEAGFLLRALLMMNGAK